NPDAPHGTHGDTNCARFPILTCPPSILFPPLSSFWAVLVAKNDHVAPARSYTKGAIPFFAYGNVAPAASHTRTPSSTPWVAAVWSARYTALFAVARLMTCSFTVKPMLRSWAVT